jgi:hypothetical protein
LIPPGSRVAIFSVDLENPAGRFVSLGVTQFGLDGATVESAWHWLGAGYKGPTARIAFPVHRNAVKLRLTLRNAFSEARISVESASIRFLMLPEGRSVPLSAVGVAYTPGTARAVSRAIAEIVTHFPHYRRTAVEHSRSVYRFHNAANLVRVLESATQPAQEEVSILGA